MDSTIDISDPARALSLPHIRYQLIRLEDTVLFHLIERAQFPLNRTIYEPGAIPIANAPASLSFMDWVLRSQEELQSKIRRYQSPDQHPFFPDAMQPLVLPELKYPKILWDNDVNVNQELKKCYINNILPTVCRDPGRRERPEAQENYGSSATADIACLQSLSQRIHFGKFVAESKFLADPARFAALIKAEDRAGIDAAITDATVEKKVLERLRVKAEVYGVDAGMDAEAPRKIDGEAVVAMYRDYVIPLTKVVEVEYLMQRLKEPNALVNGDLHHMLDARLLHQLLPFVAASFPQSFSTVYGTPSGLTDMPATSQSAMYGTCAAQKVFAVSELREMILLHLQPEKYEVRHSQKHKPMLQALLACRSVNQAFNTSIARSQRLQQALFFKQIAQQTHGHHFPRPPRFSDRPSRNILLHSTRLQLTKYIQVQLRWEGAVLRIEWSYRYDPTFDATRGNNRSWRKMFLTLEPTWVRIWIRKQVPRREHNTIRLWDKYEIAPHVRLGAVLDELTNHPETSDLPKPNRNVLHGLV